MWIVPSEQKFAIESSLFKVVPNYERHVLCALPSVETSASAVRELGRLFSDAVDRLPSIVTSENPADDPRILAWREAFREVGVSPSKFRSSVEALVRRALRRELSPLDSYLVDLGTVATLDFVAPIGVHTLDGLPAKTLTLKYASGLETFVDFSGASEEVDPGEVIYTAGDVVLTRRWVWRQGQNGSVGPSPRALAVNIDVIDSALVDGAAAIELVKSLLELGGFVVTDSGTISSATPSITLGLGV